MDRIGVNNRELTEIQEYLLKNFAVLPDIPVKAKDLFTFIGIPQDLMVTYFDNLHSLVPQWLEYKNAFYIMPYEKAIEFRKQYTITSKDIFRLISFFQKFFSEPDFKDKALLASYETYVLAILNNFKESSLPIAQLHAAYSHYLSFIGRYSEAIVAMNNAIMIVKQKLPDSPLIPQYINEQAFVYLKQGNLDKAKQMAIKAKESMDNIPKKIPEIAANIHFILGEIHFKEKQYRQAIHYFQNALDFVNSGTMPSYRLLVYIYFKLSEAFRQLKDYKKAMKYIEKAQINLNKLPANEISFYREQITMQKKVISGLSLFNEFKTKALTYGLIAIAILAIILSIIGVFLLIFK